MKELNLEIVKEYGFKNSDITALAESYLPDEQNDGGFDEFMTEVAQDIAYDMDVEIDLCDAFYDTYPTKEVEEYMANHHGTGQTLEQAIVSFLEDKIEYIKDHA